MAKKQKQKYGPPQRHTTYHTYIHIFFFFSPSHPIPYSYYIHTYNTYTHTYTHIIQKHSRPQRRKAWTFVIHGQKGCAPFGLRRSGGISSRAGGGVASVAACTGPFCAFVAAGRPFTALRRRQALLLLFWGKAKTV